MIDLSILFIFKRQHPADGATPAAPSMTQDDAKFFERQSNYIYVLKSGGVLDLM